MSRLKVHSHGTTFGSTCYALCNKLHNKTVRLRSTIKFNFTGYDDLSVLSYVAMVATPKQSTNEGCIGLYREIAIAIQDEVGDSNGGNV